MLTSAGTTMSLERGYQRPRPTGQVLAWLCLLVLNLQIQHTPRCNTAHKLLKRVYQFLKQYLHGQLLHLKRQERSDSSDAFHLGRHAGGVESTVLPQGQREDFVAQRFPIPDRNYASIIDTKKFVSLTQEKRSHEIWCQRQSHNSIVGE